MNADISPPPPNSWSARWAGLAARERQALALASAIIVLALGWWVLLAPALQTLQTAPQQHALLDQQLQRMQRLEAEAQRLMADMPPPASATPGALPAPQPDLQRSLQESVSTQLGADAQLLLQGERAQLTFKSVPAWALAAWLAQARANLKVATVEMRLAAAPPLAATATGKAGTGTTAARAGAVPASPLASPAKANANDQRWDGSLVLSLPPAEATP